MKNLLLILSLVFLLCVTFSCQQKVEEGISGEEAQSISEKVLEIWNEGNLALADEIYSPDIVRHYVDIYEDIVGIDANKQWITDNRTTFPDFHVTLEGELIFKNDKIATRFIAEGTNTGPLNSPQGTLPPTGKKVRFYGAYICQVVEGKIAEEWLYYNQASALQQLGFTLTPPQPPEVPEEKK